MKELQEIINAKVADICSSGAIQDLIETSVESAVTKALKEQFDSYNGIGRQLNKALEDKLKIDVSKIDIPTYNTLISDCVAKKVNEFWESQAASKLLKSMDNIFSPMPEEMSVREFCEKIAIFWKSDDPCNCHDDVDDRATVEIEELEYPLGGIALKMWKQKEGDFSYRKQELQPDVHLYIGKDGDIRLSHTWNPTTLREEEELIVKAYASSMKITELKDADPDDWDLDLKPDFDY